MVSDPIMGNATGPGRLLDWFFRDRATGRIVIGQWPNLPLWLFGAASALGWIVAASGWPAPGWLSVGLEVAARVTLAWWALDELLRGVNPWRRVLGGAVLLFLLVRIVRGL